MPLCPAKSWLKTRNKLSDMNENAPQNFDSTDLDRLHAAVKREKPDVRPGGEPAPLWVFIATMVAMMFGGGYLGADRKSVV